MADVDMTRDERETSAAAARSPESVADADATEKKKALLVYKSHQQSASDDDDDDDEDDDLDDDDDDDDGEDDDLDAVPSARGAQRNDSDDDEDAEDDDDDLDDAASVKSDAAPTRAAHRQDHDEDEDEDVDEDDGGVRVEKDDDESINAPSDDDLDSTATPTRIETDDDTASTPASASRVSQRSGPHDSDSSARSPVKAEAAAPAAPAAAAPMTTTASLKTGDLSAIIAARRRTGARKECEVCGEHRNGRRAMLCTQCKCMYHSSCYRQRYNKLINAQGKQWMCPDCDTESTKIEPVDAAVASTTPRKRPGGGDSNKSRAARNAAKQAALAAARAQGIDPLAGGSVALSSAADIELKRVTEIALRSGKLINNTVLERTDEMVQVVSSLTTEIDSVMGSTWRAATGVNSQPPHESSRSHSSSAASAVVKSESNGASSESPHQPPPPFTLPVASSTATTGAPAQKPLSPVAHSPTTDFQIHGTSPGAGASDQDVLLTRVYAGLTSLKHLLEQLQVTGIQFEVDLIKEIKMPTVARDDGHRPGAPGAPTGARKTPLSTASRSASAAASSANTSAGSSSANKAKNGASRLYSSKQIQKLEEWYQKSSRPESAEIQAMFRLINCPEYADKELQPDGISIKQIRIWFDNRRAKERLDYMRLKMKDVSTAGMDSESIKRMKAAYIDEAKEVLEARVSRLRESVKGAGEIVDEAGDLLLTGSGEQPLPATKSKAHAALRAQQASSATKDRASDGALPPPVVTTKSALNVKKRIRVDFVASVRKVVKEARDAGKSEEEVKAVRAAAIDRARERLHVPYKNARQGPLKPLGKDEVTHIKMKMLKLLEEDAAPEELTDVIELLMSVMIPRDILIESALHRQLTLVLKAYKDNKELIKATNKLLDEYNLIVEKGDAVFDSYLGIGPAVVDETGAIIAVPVPKKSNAPRKKKEKAPPAPAPPAPPAAAPAASLAVDVETETPGASPDSPAASPDSRRPRVKFSLEQLVKLEKHFHKDDTPSKKQLDKLAAKLNAIGARDPSSDDAQKAIDYKQIRCWFYKRRSTNQRPQALQDVDAAASSLSDSGSASDDDDDDDDAASVSSRASKGSGAAKRKAPADAKAPAPKRPKKDAKAHPGRIFNVKQLATIIEEYEKNPRPSVARMNELQDILNQDDHADDHFAHAVSVTKRQIKTWFSNRRAKERLDLIKMKVQDGSKRPASVDTGDSETEDEDRSHVVKKPAVRRPDDAPSKAPAPARDDVDMGSDDDDDDSVSSDAESERSAPPAPVAKPTMSMSMLVDDDDDDSDDDDDDDLDDDSDDA